jgi:four helix bundle protein
MDKIKDYKDLRIWQTGIEVVKKVYSITKLFPKEELYGLTNQLRRSAISIPSNIAEGFARQHNREYKQFLYISLGSCAELETQLIIAREMGYLEESEFVRIIEEISSVAKMTTNLIKKLTSD